MESDLLVIYVMSRTDNHFASYDLLQTISAAGMKFGAMNIFHYYHPELPEKNTLFSLASISEPGEFDLCRMGNFSCEGLVLFMNISRSVDPHYALDQMLETAEQLADDLDGELCAAPNIPWNDEILQHYQQKISQYDAAIT